MVLGVASVFGAAMLSLAATSASWLPVGSATATPTAPFDLVRTDVTVEAEVVINPSPTPNAPPTVEFLTPTRVPTPSATALLPSPSPTLARRTPVVTAELAETPTAIPTRSPLLHTLWVELDTLLAGHDGAYAIVVLDPAGHPVLQRSERQAFEAASLYNLGIMIEVFRQREAGHIDFAGTVEMNPAFYAEDSGAGLPPGSHVSVDVLLRQMITVSSNAAAWALLYQVGAEQVNGAMRELGLTCTETRWMPLEEPFDDDPVRNVTCAADMALLFRLLLEGKVVNAAASAEMLELLAGQLITNRLPARLPAEVIVAHKTGNLYGLVHDAGVIYTPAGPFVVAALSDGTNGAAYGVIAEIGELVYRYGVTLAGVPSAESSSD